MPPTSTAPSRGGALFTARARHLLAAGRAAEVVELCTQGLARFPDNVGGYILLAEAYRLLGQPERSRNVLTDGVRRTRSSRLRRLLEAGRIEEEARSEKREDEAQEMEETVEDVSVEVAEESEEEPTVVEEIDVESEPSGSGFRDSGSEEAEASAVEAVPIAEDDEATAVEPAIVEEGAVENLEPLTTSLAVEEPIAVAPPGVEQADTTPPLEEISQPVEAAKPAPLVEPVKLVETVRPVEIAPATPQPTVAPAIAQTTSTAPISSRTPDSGTRNPKASEPRTPAPKPQAPESPTTRLSLHVRSAPAPKLRSSNLRLIPGLEFAPLRHEENSRQRQIAPLIDDAMPEPSLPELAATTGTEPAASAVEVETVPPMPTFSETGAGFRDSVPEEDVLNKGVESASDLSRIDPIEAPTIEEAAATESSAIESSATVAAEVVPEEIETPASTTSLVVDEPALKSSELAEVDEPYKFSLETSASTAAEVDSDPVPHTPDPTSPADPVSPTSSDFEPRNPEPVFHRRQLAADNQPAMTPLEELARKLESARIPIIEESNEPPRPVFEPSLVSDTIAEILVRQGAWAEAMKAFQMLARMKPGKHAHYQERIREMRERIAAESGPPLPDHLSTEP